MSCYVDFQNLFTQCGSSHEIHLARETAPQVSTCFMYDDLVFWFWLLLASWYSWTCMFWLQITFNDIWYQICLCTLWLSVWFVSLLSAQRRVPFLQLRISMNCCILVWFVRVCVSLGCIVKKWDVRNWKSGRLFVSYFPGN